MDQQTGAMLEEAYDETVRDSIAQGHGLDVAHREGIVAASMFLSSMTGIEDAAARAQVEALGFKPQ